MKKLYRVTAEDTEVFGCKTGEEFEHDFDSEESVFNGPALLSSGAIEEVTPKKPKEQ